VSGFVAAVRFLIVITLALAALFALAGFLVAHFTGTGTAAHGVGWGMAIGGAVIGFAVGQSGSPGRMSMEGRWGAFGQFWGSNPALPESPLWLLAVSVVVMAAGIAIVVLT
jgi:hypothetical protein